MGSGEAVASLTVVGRAR